MVKRFRGFLTFSTFGAGASSRPLKREHNQGGRAGQAGLSPTAPEIRHKRILKGSAEGKLPELSHRVTFNLMLKMPLKNLPHLADQATSQGILLTTERNYSTRIGFFVSAQVTANWRATPRFKHSETLSDPNSFCQELESDPVSPRTGSRTV